MRLLSRSLAMLLLTTTCYSCNKQKIDLKEVAEKIQEKVIEQIPTTEEKQETVFKLLSHLNEKQLQKLVNDMSQDVDNSPEYVQLSAQQLAMKRDGVECVTCDVTSDDPNVRQ